MIKHKHSVGYFSSYDRGLICLLELWPQVLKQIPDAMLDIYYGWDLYDKMHHANPEMMKKKWQVIRQISGLKGVTEHGRVSHTELAKAMKATKVWSYPTEFTEIHCITALKAQEANCIPVTTDCYALETTVVNKEFSVPCTDIYTNKEHQKDYVNKLVKALKTENYKAKKDKSWYWKSVASKWNEVLLHATN